MRRIAICFLAVISLLACTAAFALAPQGNIPNAPSNPGSTNITQTSIRWTWQDNSSDEQYFKVYADPGSGAPTTDRAHPTANYWDYTGLQANSQYAFQVSSFNNPKWESAKTATITAYTLQLDPLTPTLSNVTTTGMTFSTAGLVNLGVGNSGVAFNVNGSDRAKIHTLSENVTGLKANTLYTVKAKGANAAGINTGYSNAAGKYTLALAPVFAASGNGAVYSNKGAAATLRLGEAISFMAINGFGVGEAKASKYQYVWNTNAADTDWAGAQDWSTGDLTLSAGTQGTYYLHVRSVNADNVANTSALTLGSYNIVPEPSSLLAFGTGMFGLLGFIRRRRV